MNHFIIAAIVAAGLAAAPALGQETNQANTAVPANAAENVADNQIGEPVLPVTNEPAVAEPFTEPALAPAPARERDGGFPWGLIGLVGLVGLLGRSRR